ncbi:Uma2 family endonuclease [Limnochorda pilosa]|nr:Uma2 family endonuclease [Limnochorda pilosa]
MIDDKVYDVALTYDDYRRMPEGERYELLEGDLQLTPAPSPLHQRVSRRIQAALNDHVEKHGLGEVFNAPIDVVLSHTTVVQPDVLFIARERAGIVGAESISAAPDLVIEILSPSSTMRDQVTKRRLYGRYGVREYWIVDPEARSIEVCVHSGRELVTHGVWQAGMEMESPLLEGFRLAVAPIFA